MGKSRKGASTQTFLLSQWTAEAEDDQKYDKDGHLLPGMKKKAKAQKGKPGGAGRHVALAFQEQGPSSSKCQPPSTLLEAFVHLADNETITQVYTACGYEVDAAADMLLSMCLDSPPQHPESQVTPAGGTFAEAPVGFDGWGWVEMPEETKGLVLASLSMKDLAVASCVCREFCQRAREQRARVRVYNAPAHITPAALVGLLASLPNLQSLSLSRAKKFIQDPHELQRVMDAVSTSTSLERVDLSRLPLADDDLALLVRRCQTLTELDVSGCNLLTEQALVGLSRSMVAAAARRNCPEASNDVLSPQHVWDTPAFADPSLGGTASSIRSLALAGCDAVTDAVVQAMLKAGLQSLDISHTSVSQKALHFPIPKALGLRTLRMVRCRNLTNLTLQVPTGAPLTSIALSQCTGLEHVLIVASRLEELNMASCTKLQSVSLLCISLVELAVPYCSELDYFPRFDCINLRRLNMMGCTALTSATLQHMLTGTSALTEINLEHCPRLHEISLHHVPLQTVNMSGCKLLAEARLGSCVETVFARGCVALVDLRVDSPRLKHLDISNCEQLRRLLVIGRHAFKSTATGCAALPVSVQQMLAERLVPS
eukprot:CAMPEP_0114301426 /NCGR_PEP_ID=MMETSP0059-20121206/14101_1 /TAXON_ID=36894 /ORGANISM="Pyramimonas parkeae, Strain CCMP726" /LENGTH=598 /DNA_ID=CAMNT_0001424165 /DNA_START=136 /DNA_END=1932 /DNA_ORIENTATION=-